MIYVPKHNNIVIIFHFTMIYLLQFGFFGFMKSVTFLSLHKRSKHTVFFALLQQFHTEYTFNETTKQNKSPFSCHDLIGMQACRRNYKKYTYLLLTNFRSEFVLHNWHTVLG